MAKRTLHLDKLEGVSDSKLLLEGLSKIAAELRRRANKEREDGLDTDYTHQVRRAELRAAAMSEVIATVAKYPGDFDKLGG